MIILKLKAGLGNQLFEYAYARSLALRSNTELKLDLSWFEKIPGKDTSRTYDLKHYKIVAEVANPTDFPLRYNKLYNLYKKIIGKIKRDFFGENDYIFYPKYTAPIAKNKTVCVEGHFNSEKYFVEHSDIIRKELTLKEPLSPIAKEAEDELTRFKDAGKTLVLLHVRRGDYVTNNQAQAFHGTKGEDYYKDAIAKIKKELTHQSILDDQIVFVLASDDLVWVNAVIVPLLSGIQYVILSRPGVTNYEEIYLMSCCTHFIIANSSFSWWGAWLSTTAEISGGKKMVIGPLKWVNDLSVKTTDVLPESWIRI